MRKARIERRETIVVPIVGENGKFEARKWLWEYLKRTDQIATVIKHFPDKITAEIVCREEKEF
jgi:hypothetical protein